MKWAVIGASNIAREWVIGAIRDQPGSQVVALVESNADYGRAYAEQHGIPNLYGNLAAAFAGEDVDAVYISSTNEKHFGEGMQVIEAGKHLLCEKPLAISVEDAVTMVEAAEKKGVVFATNHHMRCAGSHRVVRDLVKSNRLGRLLSVRIGHAIDLPKKLHSWRVNSPSAGGGVTYDVTVHNADMLRFMIGDDPVSVIAETIQSGLGSGVEDSAMSVWTMSSGILVSSHESYNHPFAVTSVEIHGTEGAIFARDILTQKPIGQIELMSATGVETIPFPDHNLYTETVRLFERAVAGEGEPACTGWDGVKSLAIVRAVQDAAKSGHRVNVDYAPLGRSTHKL